MTDDQEDQEFVGLVAKVHAFLDEPANVARFYNALVARSQADAFNAKALNMHTYATPIMKQLAATNRQTTLDQVEQLRNETGVVVAPQNALVDVLVKQFHVSSAQTPHLMNELGWKKVNVKWGGADYVRVLWIHSDFMVDRGKIYGPDHDGTKVVDYLEGLPTTNPFAELDLAL